MTSKLFGGRGPRKPHLLRNGDVGGEITALREDIEQAMLERGALLYTEEFTNAATASATWIKASSATLTTASEGASVNAEMPNGYERNVTVTLSAAVGAYALTPIEVDTVDQHGVARTLTFTPGSADGGATLQSNEGYGALQIVGWRIPAQADTDGAISIGYGAGFGLRYRPRMRAGYPNVLRQVISGTGPVTSGTFLDRRYIPASAPNAALDFSLTYEIDATET